VFPIDGLTDVVALAVGADNSLIIAQEVLDRDRCTRIVRFAMSGWQSGQRPERLLDKIGVATLTGAPTDLTIQNNLLGVIDGGNGVNSNVSLFDVSSEGELTQRISLKIAGQTNGAAIIQ
jgi:hypothetical protein